MRLSQLLIRSCIVAGTIVLLMIPGIQTELLADAATRQALTTTALRVCADPENLPFSNKAEEGFENKIVDLIAEELDLPVRYTWWPQTIGFVRNTLRLRECDLISGISTTSQLVQNTNPYYRSVYTMIYRSDSGITATRIGDPQLADKRFGVVAGTPPATLLAINGLISQAKGYQLIVDTRITTTGEIVINDLSEGVIDVALLWGPIGSYFASRASEELTVVPLLEEEKGIRLDFRISMATRYSERDWKRKINRVLRKLQPQIDEILASYHVPMLDDLGQLRSVSSD